MTNFHKKNEKFWKLVRLLLALLACLLCLLACCSFAWLFTCLFVWACCFACYCDDSWLVMVVVVWAGSLYSQFAYLLLFLGCCFLLLLLCVGSYRLLMVVYCRFTRKKYHRVHIAWMKPKMYFFVL